MFYRLPATPVFSLNLTTKRAGHVTARGLLVHTRMFIRVCQLTILVGLRQLQSRSGDLQPTRGNISTTSVRISGTLHSYLRPPLVDPPPTFIKPLPLSLPRSPPYHPSPLHFPTPHLPPSSSVLPACPFRVLGSKSSGPKLIGSSSPSVFMIY
jgi:hypothetical protein